MTGTAVLARIRRLTIVAIAVAGALIVAGGTGNASGMGESSGGGGFKFNPNITIEIQPGLLGPKSVAPKCPSPSYYSRDAKKCVYPPSDSGGSSKPNCKFPMFYSPDQRRCVLPVVVVPQKPVCESPMVYSRQLGKCVYPVVEQPQPPICQAPSFYSPQLGKCVYPAAITCAYPYVKSGPGCACAPGYNKLNGQCLKPAVSKPPVVAIDYTHIQQCLANLGYDPGPIDGTAGSATKQAFRQYQQQNGLGKRPNSLSDQITQVRLFQQCAAPEKPPQLVDVAPIPPKNQGRCLPPDLYGLLKASYGGEPALPACKPTAGACLPKPAFYSEAKIDALAKQGVNWCDNACIKLGAYLPLAAIQQIENAAGVTLCAAPQPLCHVSGQPIVQKQVQIRTIYKTLPVSVGNDGNIAVVVGNETYGNDITPNVYGKADADAIDQLLTEQLGYRKENIIDLRDATLADLVRVFGTGDQPEGELYNRIKKQEPGDVIIYIASHGMAKEEGGTSYLLPVDVDPAAVETSGYPLQQLYTNIGKAGARTVMLMLEATFAKTVSDLVNPPNIPELEVAAMPETPIPGLAVFTASDRDQHALDDPEYGVGLFTRYVIAGLAGEADAAPIGNGDKRIDTVELYVYAADMVRTAARKSFGVEQKPILSKIDNLLVGTLAGN